MPGTHDRWACAMTLIESNRTLEVGKYLEHQALSQCFQRSIRQSIMLSAARISAPVKFAFSIRPGRSNAQLHLTRRIKCCGCRAVEEQYGIRSSYIPIKKR